MIITFEMIRGWCQRFVFWGRGGDSARRDVFLNGSRFADGNGALAVAMSFLMMNGHICLSLQKLLAISLASPKIASDCGCNIVVHSGLHLFRLAGPCEL